MLNICLIDDHRLFSEGLADILRSIKWIDSIVIQDEPLKILRDYRTGKYQIFVVDINMPTMNGYELLSKIRNKDSLVKIVLVSVRQDFYSVEKARFLGANAYVFKNSTREKFIKAIELVNSGETFFEERMTLPKEGHLFSNGLKIKLTKREVEVLQLLSHELTTKEIASKLFISENTVVGYRKNLFQKFEVKNMCGLIKYAIELN